MRFSIILTALLLISNVFAQTKLSYQTKEQFSEIASKLKDIDENQINQKWLDENLKSYPIYKVNGVFCLSTLALVERNFSTESISNFFTTSIAGDVAAIKIPLNYVNEFLTIEGVIYLETAQRIQSHNNRMITDARVDSVWQGIDLPQGFTGKNVLIGITDWGYDFEHPMFMDTTLTQTRIRAAWDHFKLSGNTPEGMNYGAVYNTPQELLQAKSDTFGTYYGYATHGSHVAGIAGGSGAGTQYRGVAFESEYLFNSIQLDAGAAIDAFNWMKSVADADDKRLVINMSWGLYYIGTLDGNSLLSRAIDNLSNEGIVFVTSAGNNGDVNFHIKKEFDEDTITSRINFYGYNQHANMWGQCISMWGEEDKPFSVQLLITNNSGNLLAQTDIFNTTNNEGYFDTILVYGTNNDTIFYNFTIEEAHPLNGRCFMQLRVKNEKTTTRVILKSFADSGTVHYWNVVELDNGVGNWGQAFTSAGAHGVNGDKFYGIGEPAATQSVITVAAHTPESINSSQQVSTGSLAVFSSRGPLYNGEIKPDISAPGVNIVSSINPYFTGNYNSVAFIIFDGRTYDFAPLSGTSMSSPVVAGVCALILEANAGLSPQQVKEIIKSTARIDDKTGEIIEPGTTLWGMGKLNATLAVDLALKTEVISMISDRKETFEIMVFPNPAQQYLNIFSEQSLQKKVAFSVFNLEGKLVFKDYLNGSYMLNIDSWSPGMYIVQFELNNNSRSIKFTKN